MDNWKRGQKGVTDEELKAMKKALSHGDSFSLKASRTKVTEGY